MTNITIPSTSSTGVGAASLHPEYNQYFERWAAISDALRGEFVVKQKGIKYLPALSGQAQDEYDRYKKGAKWYNAPALTVAGLTGMVTRKPIIVEVPNDVTYELLKDVTLKGSSLDTFCADVITEVLTYARAGGLVDYSDEKQLPYMCLYGAADILNWHIENDKLSLVVLREQYYEQDEQNDFLLSLRIRYRVLTLTDNVYTIRIYEETPNGEPEVTEEITPTIRGNTLDYIPFYFFTSGQYGQFGTNVSDPPIESLVNLAYHYYLISADYNWGIHWVALPTPYVTGVVEDTVPNTLGPHQIWGLPIGATCGLLEYTGQGLGELREAMETDKREMADSGARLLETRARAAEAAKTVDLKQTSDSSILAGIVSKIDTGMNQLLRWYVAWTGQDSTNVSLVVNKDFIPEDINPELLNALVAALQAGEISRIEFFNQLKKGEIITGDKTFEEHEAELEEDASKRAIVMQTELQMQQDVMNLNAEDSQSETAQ